MFLISALAANQVVRYPYRAGARRAEGPAEVILRDVGHERGIGAWHVGMLLMTRGLASIASRIFA